MTYFVFFKQLLLHPVSFLDSYIIGNKTSKEFKQKAFTFAWISPTLISSIVLLGIFWIATKSVIATVLAPLCFTAITYLVYILRRWFFDQYLQWADISLTSEQSRVLFMYREATRHVFSLTAWMILLTSILFLWLLYSFIDPVIGTLFFIIFLLAFLLACIGSDVYITCLSYTLVAQVTGISVQRYVMYLIICPFIIGLVIVGVIVGMLVLVFLSQLILGWSIMGMFLRNALMTAVF